MKLTKGKAIKITIELWTFLAETGKEKEDWDGWEKYGEMECGCPFCEYTITDGDCGKCPYNKKFGACSSGFEGPPTIFVKWVGAQTPKTRKKYAKLFLEQLKEI